MPGRHKGEVKVWLYPISTLALDRLDGQCHARATSPSGNRPSTHCTRGGVGLKTSLDGSKKSRPTWVQTSL
jgi:hypothetical protein